jgi:hypothetical protein
VGNVFPEENKMNQQSTHKNTPQPEYEFDPFADPRTIPTGWDLSEMFIKTECLTAQLRPALNDPDQQERVGGDF